MTIVEDEADDLYKKYSKLPTAQLVEISEGPSLSNMSTVARLALQSVLQERKEAPVQEQTEILQEANDLAKKSMSVAEKSINIARRTEARTEAIYTLMIWTFAASVLAVCVTALALLIDLLR